MSLPAKYLSLQIGRIDAILAIVCILIAGCRGHSSQPRPSVAFAHIPRAGEGGPENIEQVSGTAAITAPGQQIVLYAKNGNWWVQPLRNNPFTRIETNGMWKNMTHIGHEYAALLVASGYRPAPTLPVLPSVGSGVIAIATVKGIEARLIPSKVIHFSGYDWTVRSDSLSRGNEIYAYDPANAWIDEKGYLHLRMGERDGSWSGAEVSLTRSLGYGTYKFIVQDSAHLEPSGVLGLFTADERRGGDTRVELDIEMSQWGKPESKNAQYVVQPYYVPANVARFSAPSGVLTHVLRWTPGVASFKTVRGSGEAHESRSISEHVFTAGIPTPAAETAHINLYDFNHSRGTSQRTTEVVIEKFEYLP